MAPTTRKGSAPVATASGRGASGGSWERSCCAGEEPEERPAATGGVVADRAAQHRVAGFEGVENRALSGRALDVEFHLSVDLRQRPQMKGEHDPDHESDWTSTERTAGRSRTMGAQLSPESLDAYT